MYACVSRFWQTLTDLQASIIRLVIFSLIKVDKDNILDKLLWVRYLNITDIKGWEGFRKLYHFYQTI